MPAKPALKRNAVATTPKPAKFDRTKLGVAITQASGIGKALPYQYEIKPPELMPGVVPQGATAPVMAADSVSYGYASRGYSTGGFPGFAYLSQLATRAEYRAFASTLSTELTREWIEFTSKQTDDVGSAERIKKIEAEFTRMGIRDAFMLAAQHDCYFGRAQFYYKIKGSNDKLPLILHKNTVALGSFERVAVVEAVWTTPSVYNANDPSAQDFYKPSSWFMLGQEVHASRLATVITRPLPDILKPAYSFAGMSLSQLAEPYVDNWLRTRQSVADLIANFSITVLSTAMDAVLQGDDEDAPGTLIQRAQLFTASRNNLGLMLLDKEREELGQVNTPLSGLHELQAQSQEQMCSVSRTPAIILTGISPGGLNASSDSEIRVFYDWIAAQQEAFWRDPLDTILKLVQLSLFGDIDPDIGFTFVPLYQMTPKELAEIRKSDADSNVAYINAGVVGPSEVREQLAADPNSNYQGLDTSMVPVPPAPPPTDELPPGEDDEQSPGAQDAEFKEVKQSRKTNKARALK